MSGDARLFSYGTLRDAGVQQALFGRRIAETADALRGYALGTIEMDDETVVGLSGKTTHLILRFTGDPADRIDGATLLLSPGELAIADEYETEAYARIEVMLASGEPAFVYVDGRDAHAVAGESRLG